MRRFFGKYRGKVTANKDPFHLGRVQVNVPAIFGDSRNAWALPCTPYAGKDIGFFCNPPIQANVWVEFEGGDPDYPIWSGCFWAINELPTALRVADPVKIQMFEAEGITLTWSNLDNNKSVSLEVDTPVVQRKLKIVLNEDGIEINNKDETTVKLNADKIELKNRANTTVTLNTSDILIKEASVETKLTASSIDLTCSPATLKLSNNSGIEMGNAPSTAKLSASGIEMGGHPASFKLTPASVEISNTAANIKLSPVSVNVNNGALEVI